MIWSPIRSHGGPSARELRQRAERKADLHARAVERRRKAKRGGRR